VLPGLRDRFSFGSSSAGVWYIGDRMRVAYIAWSEIVRDPRWFGAGVGQFLATHPEIGITVHNFLLQELYEVGILGFLVWLAAWWIMWRAARRQYCWARACGAQNAALHWWSCALAVVLAFVANLSSPIAVSRSEWLVPLLAAGTWPLWSYAQPTPAPAAERNQPSMRVHSWGLPARPEPEAGHVRH